MRRARAGVGVGLAVVLGGCGPTATRVVQGDCPVTFWQEIGASQTRPGCGETTVSTWGLDSSDGWVRMGSTQPTTAGFTLPAPSGPYLLGVAFGSSREQQFYQTEAGSFSLAQQLLGWMDLPRATSPTVLSVDVEGLEPWDGRDSVQLTSSGSSTWGTLHVPAGSAVLDGGLATTLEFDWSATPSRLPDGQPGDVLTLHQLAARPVPGTSFVALVASRQGQLPWRFRMTDGQRTQLSVTLSPVAGTATTELDLRASTFASHLAELNPAARAEQVQVLVDATALRLQDRPRPLSGTPDLLLLSLPPDLPDPQLLQLEYGRFLPSTWVEYRVLRFWGSVVVTALGAQPYRLFVPVVDQVEALPAMAGPVTPAVTPPRSPRLDGRDAFATPTGVGTTPVFSWTAPAVGTPTAYLLQLFELGGAAGQPTTLTSVGYLVTASTSLRLPPGVVETGKRYLARLTARVKHPDTFDTRPYRLDYPMASASTVFTFAP